MGNYTLGPWYYRSDDQDDWGVVRAPPTEQGQWAGGVICQARDPDARDSLTLAMHREAGTDPWEANARLITTAPDGLALAQAILADCTDTTPQAWVDMASALVAKAEGR